MLRWPLRTRSSRSSRLSAPGSWSRSQLVARRAVWALSWRDEAARLSLGPLHSLALFSAVVAWTARSAQRARAAACAAAHAGGRSRARTHLPGDSGAARLAGDPLRRVDVARKLRAHLAVHHRAVAHPVRRRRRRRGRLVVL
eukprot:3478620-Pleurochrysis_carterae.AAC.2